jgi:peptidoglycan hydrolase-like protein with peptidoglycan-binding domain
MTAITDDAFVRLFQERAGLNVDGWAGRETVAALDAAYPPSITSALAAGAGIPDDYWGKLSKIESGDRPYIKANTSSASGLYQFIEATWRGEGGLWGTNKQLAFGGLTPPPEEQLARVKTFTAKNAAYLAQRGVPITSASLYAAHFLGPVTAAAVLRAAPDARADVLAGPAATRANQRILAGKTVGEFRAWLERKTS